MAETLCISGTVIWKAGANASSTITGDPVPLSLFINQAEGEINSATRFDWVTAYSGLNSISKLILEEACSNLAAIYTIQYDMSGYTSRGEAESMITILRDGYLRAIQFLRDIKTQTFLGV